MSIYRGRSYSTNRLSPLWDLEPEEQIQILLDSTTKQQFTASTT